MVIREEKLRKEAGHPKRREKLLNEIIYDRKAGNAWYFGRVEVFWHYDEETLSLVPPNSEFIDLYFPIDKSHDEQIEWLRKEILKAWDKWLDNPVV